MYTQPEVIADSYMPQLSYSEQHVQWSSFVPYSEFAFSPSSFYSANFDDKLCLAFASFGAFFLLRLCYWFIICGGIVISRQGTCVHYTQYYVILEIANIHSCVLSMIGFCPNFQSCTVLHKWKFEFR